VGYFTAKTSELKSVSLIKYYFIAMNLLYSLLSFLLIVFPGKSRSVIHFYDRRRIGTGILIVTILQCLPLLFYNTELYIAAIFTITFFAGNTFLPIYLTYGTLLTVFASGNEKNYSFEEFCKRFEVSPRETDIVREICNGLTNKEISDKLFISLQTVKDHTHRIYIKTNVKSRVQLIYLVKELKKL
jgi:DNA-binding CsgD family transcriptional regulator